MQKLFSGIKKEYLILIRDLPGLGVLFLMPVLLILVVSLAQKNALKSSKEARTEILLLDNANTALSHSIAVNLSESELFTVTSEKDGKKPDSSAFISLIAKGDFPAGLYLGPGDSVLRIVTDPSLQVSYRNSIKGSMTYIIKGTQSRAAIENLLKAMSPGMESTVNSMISSSISRMPEVKEIFAAGRGAEVKPTLTQNLIPGFILFAMFFIALPLSGSLITEKTSGTFQRLRSLPVNVSMILSSKVFVYLVVCMLQFLLMILVGTWLLPVFFGVPALQMGNQYLSILAATLAAALAATGFGLLVGSVSTTIAQASVLGSMFVVILGLLSGTFLPVYLMPKFLQYVSLASPIRWGIDTYLDIFIRDASFFSIIPKILFLLIFFILAMTISILTFARKI